MNNFLAQDKSTLEAMIDSAGFTEVLRALSDVALDKAEHIIVNWSGTNSTALANSWLQVAKLCAESAKQTRKMLS